MYRWSNKGCLVYCIANHLSRPQVDHIINFAHFIIFIMYYDIVEIFDAKLIQLLTNY
jgi:hypothetical protein